MSIHPIITLPTRVSLHSATLVDNFFCDFVLLPASASVIKTDIKDHFFIAYHNKSVIKNLKYKSRQFNAQKNLKFTNLLTNTRWDDIYTITDPNKAFNYFENKLEKII